MPKLELVIASLRYSSWSIRAWLALTHAGARFNTKTIGLLTEPDWKEQILAHSPAGKIPVLLVDDVAIHESLAICEWTNERFPDAGLWPEDPMQRARARAVSAEMASGFEKIREHLPMHDHARVPSFEPDEATHGQIEHLFESWRECLSVSGGPYLFGGFSIADCMYLPMASRLRTYGISLTDSAASYCQALWSHPAVNAWTEAARSAPAIPVYDEYVQGLGGVLPERDPARID
jgi:glutathione S-transferase